MAILQILQYPNEILQSKAEPITEFNEELESLAKNMIETMYQAQGVGLAANQVGVLKRIVVIDVSEEQNSPMVLCNPRVVEASSELVDHEEGCLSLKGLYEKVKRPGHVVIEAQNIKGESIDFEADGLLAVCVQHEIDHLDGTVFIDHLSRFKKDRACTKLKKLRNEDKKRQNQQ